MIRSKMSEEAIGEAKWLVGIDTGTLELRGP
jgi:hypothetical protein